MHKFSPKFMQTYVIMYGLILLKWSDTVNLELKRQQGGLKAFNSGQT